MKHIIVSILAISGLVLGGSSLALAQDTESSKTYFGTSASLHYIIPSLDIHIGVEDALGDNIDLRTTLSGLFVDGGGFIGGGINGIINLSDDGSSINNYIGFGPRGILLLDGSSSEYNVFAFGIGGMWGAEFYTQNATRPYVELNTSVPISAGGEILPGFFPIFSLSAGLNFHF